MPKYLVAVTLWVRRGAEEEFRQFETKSLGIAARHGGQMIRAARLCESARGEVEPYEFHLLEFPDREAFLSYRNDPESRDLDSERERLIEKADVLVGAELVELNHVS